jgi:COMPASS component SWD2
VISSQSFSDILTQARPIPHFYAAPPPLAAGRDSSIHLYDVCEGRRVSTVQSRKYGASCIKFTHHEKTVVYASTRVDHKLRLHSLHDNKYIRYFDGHRDQVTGVAVSAINDLVLSSGRDATTRLWDLRRAAEFGTLRGATCIPQGAFDHQGLVFAVGDDPGVVKLFDMRKYTEGPFLKITAPEDFRPISGYSKILFSFDGAKVLTVGEAGVTVFDSFAGTHLATMTNYVTEEHERDPDQERDVAGKGTPDACFTPDGQHVMVGGADHAIRIHHVPGPGTETETETGRGGGATTSTTSTTSTPPPRVVAKLEGHAGRPTSMAWSTRRLVLGSACHAVALWGPDLDVLKERGVLEHVV